MMAMAGKRSISIPEKLAKRIDKRVKSSEFSDAGEYITYVMEQVMDRVEGKNRQESFSKEDEEKIKKRLRSLGYLE